MREYSISGSNSIFARSLEDTMPSRVSTAHLMPDILTLTMLRSAEEPKIFLISARLLSRRLYIGVFSSDCAIGVIIPFLYFQWYSCHVIEKIFCRRVIFSKYQVKISYDICLY